MINNGKGTQPKKHRNQELVKDYQGGMSVVRMVNKYGISSKRIYAILKNEGVEPNRK